VLKRLLCRGIRLIYPAAAFGRLCVETPVLWVLIKKFNAAAFGRLCVETA